MTTNNIADEIEVKDLAGNKSLIKYNVDWIDKEPPKINGIEDGEFINEYITLEYTDNVEVKSVTKNRIGDMRIYINYFYQNIDSEINYYRGYDENSVNVRVVEIPRGTEIFSYYINGELKVTTKEKDYTFENLEKGKKYEFYVETTKDEIIYKSDVREQRTALFEDIILTEDGENVVLNIKNLDSSVYKVRIAAWNELNNQDDIQNYYIEDINKENFEYKINIANHNNLKGVYSVHVYLYDENENELGMYPGRYEFLESRVPIEENEFYLYGTYEVIVKDTANNETTKVFTIDVNKPIIDIEVSRENSNCIIKKANIIDESAIVKVEYLIDNNIVYSIEKEEITNEEIANYVYENINNDSIIMIKAYDKANNVSEIIL